jgi:ElaB/YqjD/DUF883 family membrane-anchored ribosome-binding protein
MEFAMKAHARNATLLSTATDRARHVMDLGADAYHAAAKQTRAMGKNVDHYVRANPWIAVGAALGLGMLMGMLCRRK